MYMCHLSHAQTQARASCSPTEYRCSVGIWGTRGKSNRVLRLVSRTRARPFSGAGGLVQWFESTGAGTVNSRLSCPGMRPLGMLNPAQGCGGLTQCLTTVGYIPLADKRNPTNSISGLRRCICL